MKPIIFNTSMVQAILESQKTQTRRAIKPTYRKDEYGFQVVTNKGTGERWVEKYNKDKRGFENPRYVLSKYQPGDILWVRETWRPAMDGYTGQDFGGYWYRADSATPEFNDEYNPWCPSIHMPKEAARLFLRVTGVWVERLRDINYDNGDIWAEGIRATHDRSGEINSFIDLWDSINAKCGYGWDTNPWVWGYEFERISKEEAYAAQAAKVP